MTSLGEAKEFIEHHGVKGMKWGSRKKRVSTVTPGTREHPVKFKKPAHSLTDEELQKRVKRLEMEKKYNDLKSPPNTRGKKFVDNVLLGSGNDIVQTTSYKCWIACGSIGHGEAWSQSRHGGTSYWNETREQEVDDWRRLNGIV